MSLGQTDEGNVGSNSRTVEGASDNRGNEKDNQSDDESRTIDKGPSVLSVDQSAITGESLAVEKCNVQFACVRT
jgi:H+-transporting ATPase